MFVDVLIGRYNQHYSRFKQKHFFFIKSYLFVIYLSGGQLWNKLTTNV